MSSPTFRKRSREQNSTLFVAPVASSSETESRKRQRDHDDAEDDFSSNGDDSAEDDEDDDEDEDADAEEEDAEDDDAENESTHSQTDEPLPNHPAYHDNLPHLVKRAEDAASDLYKDFCNAGGDVADVKAMAAKALQAAKCPAAQKPVIMLLGDTGTGKSSTTNSFVDDLHATKAAAAGSSCTVVPTFIMSALPAQTSECAAKIVFFNADTRYAFLQEQLENYNRFHFELDSGWPDEQVQEYAAQANTAAKIFRALFCDQEEYESPGSLTSTLSEAHETSSPDSTLSIMMEWCDELLSEYGEQDGNPSFIYEADSTKELNKLVDPHIFESSEFEEPALWPLIQHVIKGIKGSRILDYVGILDLPGTSDVDRVRGAIAHKFIQRCDALWVVTQLLRAISNSHVDRCLATYGQLFGDNVAVIATHSDDGVDDSLKKEMVRLRQNVGNWREQKKSITKLRREIAAIEKRLKSTGNKRQKKMSDHERGIQFNLKENKAAQLEQVRNTQFEELVEVRNSHITRGIIDGYKKHLSPGSKLQVFCISNTHYAALKGRASNDSRQLSAEGTGIPKLREFGLLLAAPAYLRAQKSYISSVAVLAKGAAMWATAIASQKRDGGMLKLVGEPSQLWGISVDIYAEQAKRTTDEALVKPLISGRPGFVKAAITVHTELTGWNASIFRAFVANEGAHRTPKKPYEVWNERFMEDQTETTFQSGWADIIRNKSAPAQAVDKIIKQLEQIPDALSQHPSSVPLEVSQFGALLDRYNVGIEGAKETRMDEYSKELRNIKLSATRDVASGYFTRAMRPTYQDASAMSGPGCTDLMKAELLTCLKGEGDTDPFKAVTHGLKRDLDKAVNTMAENLREDVSTILSDMYKQFVLILRRKDETSAEGIVRKKLKPILIHADRKLDNIVAELATVESDPDKDD